MNQRDKREEKLTASTTQASKIMMIDMAEAALQFLIDLILIQKDLKSVSTVGSRRRQRLKDSRLRNPRSILHTIIYLILSGSIVFVLLQFLFLILPGVEMAEIIFNIGSVAIFVQASGRRAFPAS